MSTFEVNDAWFFSISGLSSVSCLVCDHLLLQDFIPEPHQLPPELSVEEQSALLSTPLMFSGFCLNT